MALVIPGALLLAITFVDAGKKWLHTKAATAIVIACGGLLLIYSFIN
jgi:hypothetical protein